MGGLEIVIIIVAFYVGYKIGHRFDDGDERDAQMVGRISAARQLLRETNDFAFKDAKDRRGINMIISERLREFQKKYHDKN